MATHFTNFRDFSEFEFCPGCGEELEHEYQPEGTGERVEVTCPNHGLVKIPHAGLDRPRGGRKTGEEKSRWGDGAEQGRSRGSA